MILAASSCLCLAENSKNKHPHPLIFMRVIQSNILGAFDHRGLCLMLGFSPLLFARPGRCVVGKKCLNKAKKTFYSHSYILFGAKVVFSHQNLKASAIYCLKSSHSKPRHFIPGALQRQNAVFLSHYCNVSRELKQNGINISCISSIGSYDKTLLKFRQYSMRITVDTWLPAVNMLEIGLEKYGSQPCQKYS